MSGVATVQMVDMKAVPARPKRGSSIRTLKTSSPTPAGSPDTSKSKSAEKDSEELVAPARRLSAVSITGKLK